MLEITRYGVWPDNHVACVRPEPKGDWVRFTDHQQAVERLEREVKQWNGRYEAAQALCNGFAEESGELHAKIADLQAQLAAANDDASKLPACEICWAVAWVPVDPRALKEADTHYLVKGLNLYRCDCCWLKQQVAQLRERTERQAQENYDLTNELERLQTAHTTLQRELDNEKTAYKKLAEQWNKLDVEHTTLRGLVEKFIEAWDHDGEPNAAAYEAVVDKARKLVATLPREGGAQETKNG